MSFVQRDKQQDQPPEMSFEANALTPLLSQKTPQERKLTVKETPSEADPVFGTDHKPMRTETAVMFSPVNRNRTQQQLAVA